MLKTVMSHLKCPRKFLSVRLKSQAKGRKQVNFAPLCPAILLLYASRPYFPYSKPVKLVHYKALRVHILRVLLTKYGIMAR